jgi:uncharacterized protein (DUF362 family)
MKATSRLTRRQFLRYSALAGAGTAFSSSFAWAGNAAAERFFKPPFDLAIANGESPVKNCLAAVEALGGFSRFVRSGDVVAIKPNPIGTNPPEQAINTHPEMIEAVVTECFTAGAKDVVVVSHDPERPMTGNGTADAVQRAGGTLKAINDDTMYRAIAVPRGRILRTEQVSTDVLDADVFINMPIAKHHAGSEVTLSMKNLMGIIWDRIRFHQTDLHQCIAELNAAVPADLIIMDANHVLLTNGPGGPGEVRRGRRVIAGIDPVAIDAFSARAYWREPDLVRHIRIAYDLGVGEIDISKLVIKEFDV